MRPSPITHPCPSPSPLSVAPLRRPSPSPVAASSTAVAVAPLLSIFVCLHSRRSSPSPVSADCHLQICKPRSCCPRLFLRLYNEVVAKPQKLRSAMVKQGVSGPPPTFYYGNIPEMTRASVEAAKVPAVAGVPPTSHNTGAALLPFFDEWRKKYGDIFFFSLGSTQIVHVTQPDMVREIVSCKSLDFGKPEYQAKERGSLLGQGILTSNGPHWAYQRKIIAPELYLDKVKEMVNLIQDSAETLVNSWKDKIVENGGLADIYVDMDLRSFSGDVISKACFGSSFEEGKQIFFKLQALQEASSKRQLAIGLPGFRYLPTQNNREQWALQKEIRELILNVVKERKAAGFKKDFLQMVLEGAENSDLSQDAIDRFIVDNCKNIYSAGFETTAVTASWCLMLLASHPEWQQQIREEVLDICKGKIPDAEMIKKMKLLTMAINETIRLYPPVCVLSREALTDLKFGDLKFPKGVNIWTLATTLHTDPEVWGPDSYQFNPARFANGTSGACKYPHLYMPFGIGPRVCLGQHLALVELKILVGAILSRFTFSLSPKYVHSPLLNLVTVPGHGVHLLMKEL